MRVPYNRDDQIVMGIMAFVLLLLLAAFASQIRQRADAAGQIEMALVIIEIIGFATFIFTLIMRTVDYWIDETGVYARILFGKVTVKRLPRERICFFGVVPIVSGRYRKIQITFSDKMPRHPVEGYAERIRGMIHFDYTPERYAAICRIFTPAPHAVVIRPGDDVSS